MSKKVRTAKGNIIDWDLFKIKESLSISPTSVDVKARERFIENKMKRRLKRAKNKMQEETKEKSSQTTKDMENVVEQENKEVIAKTVEVDKKSVTAKKRKIKKGGSSNDSETSS